MTELPDQQAERHIICPFCGSQETEPHAMFGSLMLMEQHYCRTCRTIFERVRDDEPDRDRRQEIKRRG
jgi:hypothetical protein